MTTTFLINFIISLNSKIISSIIFHHSIKSIWLHIQWNLADMYINKYYLTCNVGFSHQSQIDNIRNIIANLLFNNLFHIRFKKGIFIYTLSFKLWKQIPFNKKWWYANRDIKIAIWHSFYDSALSKKKIIYFSILLFT